jgi:adenine-specific DNA-methyltransferase
MLPPRTRARSDIGRFSGGCPDSSEVAARLGAVTIDADPIGGDTAGGRKARGAFFTPPALCGYLAQWAVRDGGDRVLEPSCGEAAFLLALAEQLRARGGGQGKGTGRLDGVELHRASARQARSVLTAAGLTAKIRVTDFLELEPQPVYDAVVGNPPYVRYQDFSGEARIRGRQAALRAGVRLTNLASSWAAFTVHATLFLRPGGRLALVLPAELLSVNYAAQVREFLMRRFARVRLVLFTERVFPGVQEEVVLLLAEGTGPTDHCELVQVRDIDELLAVRTGTVGAGVSRWRPDTAHGKWTPAMIPADARDVYAAAVSAEGLTTLQTWGDTTLGAVTGNNRFFALTPQQVARLGLDADRELLPLSPPGSRHLRGLALTAPAWRQLGEHGRATWLFRPEGQPSRAASAYLRAGRAQGVDTAYKCRVRTPWWRVPIVPPADLLLTYMNADTPRLTGNPARVYHLNSVHGVYLRAGLRRTGAALLPLASLNSVTLLGAETVGRAYGGGMLKLEPREADLLPVPAPAAVTAAREGLLRIRSAVAADLAAGQLLDAVARVDQVLLVDALGFDPAQVRQLSRARAMLAGRRAARSAGGRAAPDRRPDLAEARDRRPDLAEARDRRPDLAEARDRRPDLAEARGEVEVVL